MDGVAVHQLHTFQVARAQLEVAIAVLRALLHQQCVLREIQLLEQLAESAGLRFLQVEALDHGQLAIGKLSGERRAQRAQQLLLGELVVVAARLRPVNGATVAPQWRTDGAHAGASGALLLPKFLARARDQLLVLGGVGTLALRGAVVLYRLPQQVFVHRAKDFFGEVERADLFAIQIMYVDGCHCFALGYWLWPLAFKFSLRRGMPRLYVFTSSPYQRRPSWLPSKDRAWSLRRIRD